MPADLLEQLWTEVINPDPEGAWIDDAIRKRRKPPDPFAEVPSALQQCIATGASREDLGRTGRGSRYEACFSTLYALDDPGPGRQKVQDLEALAEKAAAGGRGAFVTALRETFESGEDAESFNERIEQCRARPEEPFADVGNALQALLDCGVTPEQLSLLDSWHRFEACRLTLKCVAATGAESPDELAGMHESLLGADPTGKDGRPGSWPVPVEKSSRPRRGDTVDPTKPYLTLKSVEEFLFTPDGRGIVAGTKLFDAETGAPRLQFEVRGMLGSVEFSPDGRRIYFSVGTNGFIVCDTRTGKQISKTQRRGAELRWFLVHPKSGDLLLQEVEKLRSNAPGQPSFKMKYTMLDAGTMIAKGAPELTSGDSVTNHFAFAPDGSRLAAFWMRNTTPAQPGGYFLTVWRWPEAVVDWEVEVPGGSPWSVAFSADSMKVAVGQKEVVVFDAQTGAETLRLRTANDCNLVAFAPDGKHLATGSHAHSSDRLQIWDAADGRLLRELPLPTAWSCYSLCFSPDGRVLGAASHRVSWFWRFPPLI